MLEALTRRYGRREVLAAAALGVTGRMLWRSSTATASTTLVVPQWIAFGPTPTSQMFVSWSTGTASGASHKPSKPQVRWGLSTSYGSVQHADRSAQVPLPGAAAGGPAENAFYNSALLSSLSPGTTYHYQVSNDGHIWSADRNFTTALAGLSDFRFTAFGDQGIEGRSAVPMVALVASLKPAFHLLSGDLAYATPRGMKVPDFDGFHPERWDTYLAMIGHSGSHSFPWMSSVGAHEVEPLGHHGYAGFITRFRQHYDHTSGTPVAHAFKSGNVAIIHVDGNDLSAQETINTGYSNGAQTAWLKRKLAGYRTAGSGIDFIVVVCDCNCYSSNQTHGSDGGVRDAWGPLFDRYDVDLVISGHVHAYERTHPMRAGKATRQVASGGTVHPATDGTTYICAGGGGNNLYTTWYGTTGGGDAGSATPPKIWRWRGGDTTSGGTGGHVQRPDTVKHFSAFRRGAYSCLVLDVTAPTATQSETRLHIRALKPAQTISTVTSISNPAVMDSVTLIRTHHL